MAPGPLKYAGLPAETFGLRCSKHRMSRVQEVLTSYRIRITSSATKPQILQQLAQLETQVQGEYTTINERLITNWIYYRNNQRCEEVRTAEREEREERENRERKDQAGDIGNRENPRLREEQHELILLAPTPVEERTPVEELAPPTRPAQTTSAFPEGPTAEDISGQGTSRIGSGDQTVSNPHKECILCAEDLATDQYPTEGLTSVCEHSSDVCLACLTRSIDTQIPDVQWDQIKCPTCSQLLSFEVVRKHASPAEFER